ncbi:MAG TPA: ATP-binding protein [Blastocatellia bacterium]|nr:ATP-binding protein [Blastocatellia bacterium]
MSLLEILKLVGFATGAALHLYVAWLIWRKPHSATLGSGASDWQATGEVDAGESPHKAAGEGKDHGLIRSERTFIALGLLLGCWFLGNLLTTLQELLLDTSRLTGWLRAWDTITVIGISLVPSALLHSHIAFWSWLGHYKVIGLRRARLLAIPIYFPLLVLPYTIYRVNSGDYRPYMLKLKLLLLPYSIWFLLAFWGSAAIDWSMKDRLYRRAARERSFLKVLAATLFVTGGFEFVVVGLRHSFNDYLWVIYILLSLLPVFTIAYYIYRYNLYELVIKGSLAYAAFAVVFLTVYTYGVRHLDDFLAARFDVHAGVLEAILILVMAAMAGPLVRVIDKMVRRLFVQEIELYRDVVKRVSTPQSPAAADAFTVQQGASDSAKPSVVVSANRAAGALATHAPETVATDSNAAGRPGIDDVASLISYTEETIRKGLSLVRVHILPCNAESDGAQARLVEQMRRDGLDTIETGSDLESLGGTVAYALRRDRTLIGSMVVTAESRTLAPETRAVLDVLSGQVAIALESCLLVEEKVRLERELASRERLAALGEMAANVAHEVKNPLSSIKSIAQVMREDGGLADYDRDLGLIIGEVDRLSRTVSQLLAFSRAGSHTAGPDGPVQVGELISAAAALLEGDARERGVRISLRTDRDAMIPGRTAAALREVLSNLLLNAIQASPRGEQVTVECQIVAGMAPGSTAGAGAISPARMFNESGAADNGAIKIAVSVTDAGPGIPVQSRDRIFEPFYTTRQQGTGLGLAIVQRRVAELGGSLKLISPVSDGGGTCFTLTIEII